MNDSFRPDAYLKQLYANQIPEYCAALPLNGTMTWEAWREGLKSALTSSIGGFPQDPPPLSLKENSRKEMDGYTRLSITYTSEAALETPGYILIPGTITEKTPAVVAIHGHGFGVRDIVGLMPDGSERVGVPNYHKSFAVSLVKKGFLVIAPELCGFGDMRLSEDADKPMEHASCYHISTYLLMMGRTMAGVRTFQCMRAIDALREWCQSTNTSANLTNLGVMGISGGGMISTLLSALDERIKATVISGYANTFYNSVMSLFHCVDNFLPGIIKHAEMDDILALISPRPMLWESGTKDPIFPIEAVWQARESVSKVYSAQNAPENFDTDIFEGDHKISGVKAFDFLWSRLSQ